MRADPAPTCQLNYRLRRNMTDAFPQPGVCELKDKPEKVGVVMLRSSVEGGMHKSREHPLRPSRVTAVFEDRALSFILVKGATLEELSDRLADLGQRHNGRPVAVTVKFGSSSREAGLSPDPPPKSVHPASQLLLGPTDR
jgi:hypothetical protein